MPCKNIIFYLFLAYPKYSDQIDFVYQRYGRSYIKYHYKFQYIEYT